MKREDFNNEEYVGNALDNKNLVLAFKKIEKLSDFEEYIDAFENIDIDFYFEMEGRFSNCLGHMLSFCFQEPRPIIKNFETKVAIINHVVNYNYDLFKDFDSNNFPGVPLYTAIIQFFVFAKDTSQEDVLIDMLDSLRNKIFIDQITLPDLSEYHMNIIQFKSNYPKLFNETVYHLFAYYYIKSVESGFDIEIASKEILYYISDMVDQKTLAIEKIDIKDSEKKYVFLLEARNNLVAETAIIEDILPEGLKNKNLESKNLKSRQHVRLHFIDSLINNNQIEALKEYLDFWLLVINFEEEINKRIKTNKNSFHKRDYQNILGVVMNTLLYIESNVSSISKELLEKINEVQVVLESKEGYFIR